MNKLGLTKGRYKQMLEYYENDKEAVKEVVEEWGADKCNKGYDIFDFDGTGMLEVCRIDAVMAFDDDIAVQMAIEDGIKCIPVEELPENFDRRYLGWIDTPENRKAIVDYCNKYLREEI